MESNNQSRSGENKIIVGITQGDVNGIGPEVVLKALSDPAINDIITPVFFSSQKTVSYYRKVLGIEDFSFNPIRDFSQINHKKVNVFVCYEEEVNIEMGKETPSGGRYAYLSLEKAVEALTAGSINVLVTAPINKKNIQSDAFRYAGHTEYLADKVGGEPLMMLCTGQGLRVAVVTGHLPLKDVPSAITVELVSKKLQLLYNSLVSDFGIRKPRIAVLGLNPHAGEEGLLGNEEQNVIKPAIEQFRQNAIVYGPYSADGFFGSEAYRKFDAVLAMYHDQGLIPFKALSFGDGVNFTAGLAAVRTSPDHGTGYEIAGKNQASDASLKKAIYMAVDIYRNRKLYGEISQNPLPRVNIKRER